MADDGDSEGVTDSPKKGPTLSTSTSSFEALDPHDPNLSRLATTMFQKTADYLFGELTATQLALVAVCVATVGAQHIWPYGVPGILPQVAPVVAVKEPSTVVVKSLVESPVQVKGLFGVPVYPQYPHVVQVAIPSQDTTRGMPQPVEDTPEVKSAKALFAKEYEKAAIAAALAPEVRKRRDLTSEMKIETTPADTMRLRTPMQYPWPIVSHHMTAPWQLGMYGHPGMPLITAPGK